ncbi:MAG: DUF371 domain-containing protein [Methanomicrobiales archaeon]|nr:DUF371 domain-containing protein [Methanomicrobiales archaeon]
MEARELITAHGDPAVLGHHPTTFEVTTHRHLTATGDCIIAIAADKGAMDMSPHFRSILQCPGATLTTTLTCGEEVAVVHAQGSPLLSLDHPTDLVWRRSSFTCGRTIAICADTTAATLPRPLIATLKRGADLEVDLLAVSPDQGT